MSFRLSLIVVSFVLGCRDDAKPALGAGPSSSSTSPSGTRTRPQLDTKRPPAELEAHEAMNAGPARDFDSEPEDTGWAPAMAADIQTRVPGIDVRCKTRQCQVVIVAPSAEEAVARVELLRALKSDDSEKPLAQWMPLPPATLVDGRVEALVYARFER